MKERADGEIEPATADFRLMDKKVIDIIKDVDK